MSAELQIMALSWPRKASKMIPRFFCCLHAVATGLQNSIESYSAGIVLVIGVHYTSEWRLIAI
jgi:hypothetical protein